MNEWRISLKTAFFQYTVDNFTTYLSVHVSLTRPRIFQPVTRKSGKINLRNARHPLCSHSAPLFLISVIFQTLTSRHFSFTLPWLSGGGWGFPRSRIDVTPFRDPSRPSHGKGGWIAPAKGGFPEFIYARCGLGFSENVVGQTAINDVYLDYL